MKSTQVLMALFALCFSLASWAAPMSPVNINKATAEQIAENVKGLSKVKSEKIVAYRVQYGPFRQVDDLVLVKGIGEKTLAKIRDQVTVDDLGETVSR